MGLIERGADMRPRNFFGNMWPSNTQESGAKTGALALLVAVFLFVIALPSEAQQSPKIPRLCFLTFDPGSAEAPSSRFAAFFEALRELGYVHGQTISIEYLAD